MWLDQKFLDEVADLRVAAMGTDVMAPMLYSTLRFMRARNVLEAGMGFTTPFLAKALYDNDLMFEAERDALIAKTAKYVREIDAMGPRARLAERGPEGRALASIYAEKTSALGERRTEWMFADPASLMDPGYYVEQQKSRLYCVDDISAESGSASRVNAKLADLGLSNYVTELRGDFWSIDYAAARAELLFDVIWVDLPVSVVNVFSLLKGAHWEMLNPDGGLLIIHDMLTHEGGQVLVRDLFKAEQRRRFDEFEFIGMLEPHRVVQNSFIMIRKISGLTNRRFEKDFTAPGDATFETDARSLLREN